MKKLEALSVYCGSARGTDPGHVELARALGNEIAARDITLVYGAGGIGLMTEVADAALAGGGHVVGVITKHLARAEVQHKGLSETITVDSMHARKEIMFRRADAFAILPGGFGTLDEFFEVLTWGQIGLHGKPIVILDSNGYWAPLRALLDGVVDAGFASPAAHGLYQVAESISAMFALLETTPEPVVAESSERF